MARLIIKGLFGETDKATDAGPKDFRASFKETVRESNGTIVESRYLKGIFTFSVIPDEAADRVEEELKKSGLPVVRVKTALEAFKSKYQASN